MFTLSITLQLIIATNFLPVTVARDTTQNYIVIHNDGANLNASLTKRTLKARGTSYHYFISRNGKIYQFMDLKYVANHAGISQWNGHGECVSGGAAELIACRYGGDEYEQPQVYPLTSMDAPYLYNWNAFSIGVCLQGTSFTKYTDKQYESLKKLVQYINIRYPDSRTKPILGHEDVAFPRGRKNDPGEHFTLWRILNDTTHNARR